MRRILHTCKTVILSTVLIATSVGIYAPMTHAATEKESLKLSARASYYGQVENGKPNGTGTIRWGDSKSYAGQWVDGIRQGTGKYVNQYTVKGRTFVVTYKGEWSKDQRNGLGEVRQTIKNKAGKIEANLIQQGQFENDVFKKGYTVTQALADPAFSFNYKDSDLWLQIYGDNQNISQYWATGKFTQIQYRKGKIDKEYSIFPEEDAAKQLANQANLKYFKKIQPQVSTYLKTFQTLSIKVPVTSS
ncbi:hypothetical protein [Paenibacillus nuruki]|jgi:hypothetical protein|uniref:hypothetical protein n=1 Tax=Paenibacillus nuruki TaxID=1886670 RepID=UPI002806178E|nr:hypothetical protein [Paenibacillus nuruki]CAJ1314077.1 MORN repeat protein [Paenibacillus nuruki]